MVGIFRVGRYLVNFAHFAPHRRRPAEVISPSTEFEVPTRLVHFQPHHPIEDCSPFPVLGRASQDCYLTEQRCEAEVTFPAKRLSTYRVDLGIFCGGWYARGRRD